MDNKTYCDEKLRKVIEELFFDLTVARPNDIIESSLQWLMKKGRYTANGLTVDERHELLNLRKEIKSLREQVEQQEERSDVSSDSEDDEEEVDEAELEKARKGRGSIPRIAVSAEVYGVYHSQHYTPIIHPKTEDQITTIKSRIIQSFLFNSLDANELKIVIDAIEERPFNKDETVIQQGEHGDCLYMVEHGELNCFKKFVRIILI
jgi:cAMP-dependent protein kinase regulator